MSKTYSETYIYRQYPKYDKQIFEFIMKAERIDTSSDEFKNLAFDIKRRQISNSLIKILNSDNVVLGINNITLPKAFKVFVANDVRTNNKPKVFIDVSDCIILRDGEYTCGHVDWVISYLVTAMNSYIYKMLETKLTNNQTIIKDGAAAFSKLFSYILDRIYKISTVQTLRKRVEYISAIYYQVNLLGKNPTKQFDSIKATAMKVCNIEANDAQIVDIQLNDGCFNNIESFIETINRIFKFKDLKVGLILDKWMQSFGTSTIFALEYYPAFASMLTDAYIGGYINQQLTIEKIAGQNMINFTKTILQIGVGIV